MLIILSTTAAYESVQLYKDINVFKNDNKSISEFLLINPRHWQFIVLRWRSRSWTSIINISMKSAVRVQCKLWRGDYNIFQLVSTIYILNIVQKSYVHIKIYFEEFWAHMVKDSVSYCLKSVVC